jgi:hypothetical protein
VSPAVEVFVMRGAVTNRSWADDKVSVLGLEWKVFVQTPQPGTDDQH